MLCSDCHKRDCEHRGVKLFYEGDVAYYGCSDGFSFEAENARLIARVMELVAKAAMMDELLRVWNDWEEIGDDCPNECGIALMEAFTKARALGKKAEDDINQRHKEVIVTLLKERGVKE